jgi:hypothetical protein
MRTALDLFLAAEAWDPGKHPRVAPGSFEGGRFRSVFTTLARPEAQRGPTGDEIARAVGSGVAEARPLSGGQMAETQRLRMHNGTELVHKTYRDGWGPRRAAKEHAVSLIGHAIGAPVPATALDDTGVGVYMGLVPDDFAPAGLDITVSDVDALARTTDDGFLLGLLDALTANGDRHQFNWMRHPDGRLAGIDHGETFLRSDDVYPVPPISAMKRAMQAPLMNLGGGDWADEIDLHPDDVAIMRRRLEALRPEFARMRGGDWAASEWYKGLMLRFEEMATHATGTRRRLADDAG